MIREIETPCKEFLRLNDWFRHHAMRTLKPDEIYKVRKDGTRVTLGRDVKACKAVRDWLKENYQRCNNVFLIREERMKGEYTQLTIKVATPTGRLRAEGTFKLY